MSENTVIHVLAQPDVMFWYAKIITALLARDEKGEKCVSRVELVMGLALESQRTLMGRGSAIYQAECANAATMLMVGAEQLVYVEDPTVSPLDDVIALTDLGREAARKVRSELAEIEKAQAEDQARDDAEHRKVCRQCRERFEKAN